MKVSRWVSLIFLGFILFSSISCSERKTKPLRRKVVAIGRKVDYWLRGRRNIIEIDPDTMQPGQMAHVKELNIDYPWQGERKLRCVVRGKEILKYRINGKLIGLIINSDKYRIPKPHQILFLSSSYRPEDLELCHNLVSVFFDYAISDLDLEDIEQAKNLRVLYIQGAHISEHGYEIISGFKKIEVLYLMTNTLGGTWDEKAKVISTLRNLKELHLTTDASDTGIQYLGNLKNLERIELCGGKYSGKGFENWQDCKKLRNVTLLYSQVTDEGLKYICELEGLTDLWVESDSFTDAGLRHVKNLRNLTSIAVDGDQLSDEGIVYLYETYRTR